MNGELDFLFSHSREGKYIFWLNDTGWLRLRQNTICHANIIFCLSTQVTQMIKVFGIQFLFLFYAFLKSLLSQ